MEEIKQVITLQLHHLHSTDICFQLKDVKKLFLYNQSFLLGRSIERREIGGRPIQPWWRPGRRRPRRRKEGLLRRMRKLSQQLSNQQSLLLKDNLLLLEHYLLIFQDNLLFVQNGLRPLVPFLYSCC